MSAVFIELKYRWLRTCLADLKKHQTLDILLMTDFLWFFLKKELIFQISGIFGNHQLHILKALYVFISVHYFGVKKCKNQLFEENKRFECSFYRIKVQVITNLSSRLEKTPNTWHFAYDRFFMIFFKKWANFPNFRYFRKSSAAHTKSIVCVYFMLICLTKHNTTWSAHFLTTFYSRLVTTSGLTMTL